MDNFDFSDLVLFAKSISVDYDKLLYEPSNGVLLSSSGIVYELNSDAASDSDIAYDKLSALIKVLEAIKKCRPLPF